MKFVELLNKCAIPVSILVLTGTFAYTDITYNRALIQYLRKDTPKKTRDENTAFNGTAED